MKWFRFLFGHSGEKVWRVLTIAVEYQQGMIQGQPVPPPAPQGPLPPPQPSQQNQQQKHRSE